MVSSFLCEVSSVVLVFFESKFFGFGFKILIAEDNTSDEHTKWNVTGRRNAAFSLNV